MDKVVKNCNFLMGFLLAALLIIFLSTKFSPPMLFALFGITTGLLFFYVIAWNNLSNGILLWLVSFVIFAQANILEFENLPNFPIERMLWAIILLFFIAQVFTGKIALLPMTKIDRAMLVFILICIVSNTLTKGSFFAKDQGFRDLLNGFAIPYITYFISKNVFDDWDKIIRLLTVLSIILAYTIISFVFERFEKGHFLPHYYYANIYHGLYPGRFLGPFGNPAVCGAVIGITVHTTMYLQSLMRGPIQLLLRFLIFAGPVVLFFTHTRSAWLGFIVSTLLMLFLNRSLRPLILVLFAGMVVAISSNVSNILSEDRAKGGILVSRTVETRINLYKAYVGLLKERPIFGQGFGEITYKDIVIENETISSHDTYMSIMVELGLVGFSIFATILLSIVAMSLTIFRTKENGNPQRNMYIILFWALALNYGTNAFLIEMRFFLFLNALIFIFAGTVGHEYKKIS